jgi:RNA polymerase sigma factor (sigma-70 family)
MASASQELIHRSIQTLFDTGSVAGLTDGQLLERFLSRRGADAEAAFAALVTLYGPMVWDLCRSVLSDEHDAEDAFQATFLILVRRAGAIRRRDSIGPWLYGVARRVAVRAKATAARQRAREERGAEMIATPTDELAQKEETEALHAEVDRLAEKYRSAVVLCYFEGRSHNEAARLLKCPVGTVSIRLSRAREQLRTRMTRRGLALPAAWESGLISPASARAAMPSGLAASTIEVAMRVASGKAAIAGVVSASVARLAEGALSTVMLSKTLIATAGVAAAGTLAAAVVLLGRPEPRKHVETQRATVATIRVPAQQKDESKSVAVPAEDKPLFEFFGLRDRARSAVYAIDCSGSMATRAALDHAKRELLDSVDRLSSESRFAVILYNLSTRVLVDADSQQGLMAATAANKAAVKSQLTEIYPLGGTDHMLALRAASALKPEVIFFLTDADLITNGDVDDILGEVGSKSIQVVEFGLGEAPEHRPLIRLATATGGSYVYKDVKLFPKWPAGLDEPSQ